MAKDDDDYINSLKATRLLAFRAVDKKEPEYVLRYIMRWYSREFFTPLHVVEELPIDDILTHFFECRYEGMDEHELEEEGEDLRMTPAEALAKEEAEEAAAEEDDEFEREAQEEASRQEATKPVTTPARLPEGEPEPPAIPVAVMGENLPTVFKELADKADPSIKEIPPEIEMVFVDDGEMDEMGTWDLLGPPKKKDEK